MLIFMGCLAIHSLKAQDRTLEEILLPDSLFFCKPATFTVKAVINGYVNDTFRISYKLGNQPRVEEIIQRPRNFNYDSIHYTFKTLATVPATLNDTLFVTILTPDLSITNNERFIVLRNAPTYKPPFTENFEQPRFPPLDWSATPVGYYDAGWLRTNFSVIGEVGATIRAAGFSEGYEGDAFVERKYGYLMLPAMDMKGLKNPYLVFDLALIYEPFLTFGIEVSTDCGANFKEIYSKQGKFGVSNNGPYDRKNYKKDSISLASYIDSTLFIRFYAKHTNKEGQVNGVYVDNINIYDALIPTKDVALSRIISPVRSEFCPSKFQIPVEIEVKNTGAAVLDTFVVSYQMVNTPSVFDTIIRPLAFNETFIHKFSKLTEIPADGNINLTVNVRVKGDQDGRNDAIVFGDYTSPRLNLTYSENFESVYSPPQNFPSGSTTPSWFYRSNTVIGSDGKPTKAPSSQFFGGQSRIQMIPPFLDLRNNTKPFLTFDVAYPKLDTIFSPTAYRQQDTLRVQVSTDCGRTYKTIYEKRGDSLTTSKQTPLQYQMQWNPNSAADWRRDTANLAAFKDSVIIVRFVSLMGGYGSTFLDNLKVEPGYDFDMGIVERLLPTSPLVCANARNTLPVRFTIRNNAFLPADSVRLSYQLDTEGVVSETLIKRINPRDTVQYQFKQLMNVATTGKHNLTLIVRYLNDENAKNDTLKTTFNIANEYRPNIIEDFETAAFPPLDWQMRLTKTKGWDRVLTVGSLDNQLTIAAISTVTDGNDIGAVESLITYPVNLSNTEKPIMFFSRFSPFRHGERDSLVVDISTDCGVTFEPTGYIKTGAALPTITRNSFEPSFSFDWKSDTIDLSAYKDKTVQLRFNKIYQTSMPVFLDNVQFKNIIAQNSSLLSLLNPVETTPLCPDNPFVLAFKIRNDGTQAIDSFNLKYQIDNQAEITERIRFNIPINSVKAYQFPFLLRGASAGQHKLRVVVNTTGDSDNALDTLIQNITVRASLKAPVFENFNALPSFPPVGWIIQPSGGNTWKKATVINKYGTATPAAYYGYNNNKGYKDGLVTAPIDLKGVAKPRLLFDVACARFNNNSNDTLQAEISTDCGLNYKKIYLKSGSTLATASNWTSSEQWLPTAFLWRTDSVDLSAFADSLILLRFVNIVNNGHQLYLDDIRVADSAAIVKTKDVFNSTAFSKIYPNPTTDNIMIVLDKSNAQPVKLELLNAQGQVVKVENKPSAQTPQYEWSLRDLPIGIYMLNIYNDHRFEQHKIVLIQ